MTKEKIFGLLKGNIKDILFDLDENAISIDKSLKSLGANSIDRADIIMQTMEELGLKMQLVEFGGAKNIEGLVDLFYEKLNNK